MAAFHIICGVCHHVQGWPKSVGRSLPAWVFSEWLWALVMGLHAAVLLGVLVGPPVLVHPVRPSLPGTIHGNVQQPLQSQTKLIQRC